MLDPKKNYILKATDSLIRGKESKGNIEDDIWQYIGEVQTQSCLANAFYNNDGRFCLFKADNTDYVISETAL